MKTPELVCRKNEPFCDGTHWTVDLEEIAPREE